uniref:Uncharacterized protein n=1 Tax=Solanum tuberosum TaxID=4113 RepID=M1DKU8_SOLTU
MTFTDHPCISATSKARYKLEHPQLQFTLLGSRQPGLRRSVYLVEIPIGIGRYQLDSTYTTSDNSHERREETKRLPRMLHSFLKIRCGRQHTHPQESTPHLLLYGETVNLSSDINLSRPKPPDRASTHFNT